MATKDLELRVRDFIGQIHTCVKYLDTIVNHDGFFSASKVYT